MVPLKSVLFDDLVANVILIVSFAYKSLRTELKESIPEQTEG